MRALVITGPGTARVEDVEVPVPGAGPAIEYYAGGRVDPAPIAGVTVGLEQAAEALAGKISTGAGTKIHVDPCG